MIFRHAYPLPVQGCARFQLSRFLSSILWVHPGPWPWPWPRVDLIPRQGPHHRPADLGIAGVQELAEYLLGSPVGVDHRANQRFPYLRRLLLLEGRFDRRRGLGVFDL